MMAIGGRLMARFGMICAGREQARSSIDLLTLGSTGIIMKF
jgi:hypothetical protein